MMQSQTGQRGVESRNATATPIVVVEDGPPLPRASPESQGLSSSAGLAFLETAELQRQRPQLFGR